MDEPASQRGPDRRSAILEGLSDLFLSEGFAQLSVQAIAARIQCSKSTLYAVAPSKEQLITAVVRSFFRRATERVEQGLLHEDEPSARISLYLNGIAAELAPASAAFYDDLATFAPTREIYSQNVSIAAKRVQELVRCAEEPGRPVDAAFIGAVAAQTMAAIQTGQLRALTRIDDASGYRSLAELIIAGLAGAPHRTGSPQATSKGN